MTLTVRSAALIGASKVAALSAARVIPNHIERKDGDNLSLELKTSIDNFAKTFEEFKTKNDERIKQVEKGREDIVTKTELKAINDGLDALKKEIEKEVVALKRQATTDTSDKRTPEQKEYSAKFEQYFRNGVGEQKGSAEHRELMELEKKAGMAVNSDTDGGFTARPELETAIDATVKQVSPIRDFATVRTIGAISYKKLVSVHGTASGWVGELDGRPQTQAPQLKELDFPAMELYAMPAATSTLLDDSFVNIDQWLADEVSLEFAYQEGAAFVAGNGVKKPQGFLGYPTVANASYGWGSVGFVATGVSGDFAASNPADNVIDLFHSLKSPYRGNAAFLCNNTTLGKLRKLKDTQGRYLVDTKFTVSSGNTGGTVETLLGKPVAEVVDMPDPAANSLSLAFGDWKRAYIIVDRKGVRVLRDPYSAKPYVLFYCTKRVGGGIQNFEALKLLKFG